MKLGWGILPKQDLPPSCEGVEFDPSMPTRREEYHLVRDALVGPPMRILDAGSGLTPTQHVMPYILSRMGHVVVALDSDPRSLEMPADANVERVLGDLTAMDVEGPFDAVICISVLEHCPPDVVWGFAREAARLCKPGGLLVVTADETPPVYLATLFAMGFDIGDELPATEPSTSPRVAYLIGRRLP